MTRGDARRFVTTASASIPWVREGISDAAASGAPRSLVQPNSLARSRVYDDEPDDGDDQQSGIESRSLDDGTLEALNDADDGALDVGRDAASHLADVDHDRDAEVRRAILEADRRDRALERLRRRRGAADRIPDRTVGTGGRRRRRTAPGSRFVDHPIDGARVEGAVLRWPGTSGHRPGQRLEPDDVRPSTDEPLANASDVASRGDAVRRFAAGPLHGAALAAYCLLVPYVVVSKWTVAIHRANGSVIRALLVALSLLWFGFVFQLARNVGRKRRGVVVESGGSAWLAGLIVTALALIPSPAYSRPPSVSAVAVSVASQAHHRAQPAPLPDGAAFGSLSVALVAKRRLDRLRDGQEELDDDDVDGVMAQLRAADPDAVDHLRRLITNRLDGVVRPGSDFAYGAPVVDDTPAVACVVGGDDGDPVVAFAREGGRLRLPASWTDEQVVSRLVGLDDGGRVVATNVEYDLLRALAIRSVRRHLVVYLGDPADLDDAVRLSTVTIDRSRPSVEESAPRAVRSPLEYVKDRATFVSGIYVELLRPDPVVLGLGEPFVSTLRRRGVEMVAYLAIHRGEPVSGDRLRTRVLVHADVDASQRTLANTASTVRRSLGVDELGPRLHPVAADGLYRTHGVSSDVERFHGFVRDARRCQDATAVPLLVSALQLVGGEPLVGVRHGFEWFTVEGHLSRLQRDGEWAALALHDFCLDAGDVERAYWAVERGRRLDPYSDALLDALAHVPRLRQFRRDRASAP